MDMTLLNKIPFWIQVRGIPLQYMNREVIVHIARKLGEYIQMDYNEKIGGRMEFVHIRLNWNINNPLHFQRIFQFTPGVNTLLKLHYERLRGFCKSCGMLTHDSGRCLIQNGGPMDDPDEDNDDDNDQAPDDLQPHHGNAGIHIEEINDEDEQIAEQEPINPVAEEAQQIDLPDDQVEEVVEGTEEDIILECNAMCTMYSDDLNMEEIYADKSVVIQNAGRNMLKRKAWMKETETNITMTSGMERGEPSHQIGDKRKKENSSEETTEKETDAGTSNMWRGAVGPEPPLPP